MSLPLATAREGPYVFQTGRPVSFVYTRNTEPSPYLGSRYQQDIEPAGRYLLVDSDPRHITRGWEKGRVSFESPLVLRFSETGSYDGTSWKAALSRHFRAVRRTLSRRILKAGYDGIVTVGDDGTTREIVDLRVLSNATTPVRRRRRV